MRAGMLTLVVCCGLVGRAVAQPQSVGADASDRLAAESLANSAAALVVAPPETPARAARLVAICRLAHRLDPQNLRVRQLVATLAEIQNRSARAADALEDILEGEPADHATGLRWLAAKLKTLDDADSRLAMLQQVQDDPSLAAPLQAEAAVAQARIYDGQGKTELLKQAFAKALELDPHHPAALGELFAMEEAPTAAEGVAMHVRVLQGNPLAVSAAWEMANVLAEQGMHGEAVEMFEYAWAVFGQRNDPTTASESFLWQYLNALLDAGRADDAVEKFQPLAARVAESSELAILMIEALRQSGQQDAAAELAAKVAERYKVARITGETGEAGLAAEARFHLRTLAAPAEALKLAEQAARTNDSPLIQGVLGASEIAAGQTDQGLQRLQPLVGNDPYAAAAVAEHYLATGDEARGLQIVAEALSDEVLPYGGAAWRRLRALAEEKGVSLPSPPEDKVTRIAAAQWSEPWREMGLHPESTLAVTLAPANCPDATVAPGRSVELIATLTNTGRLPVPLGEWGLMSPTLAITVDLEAPDGLKETFSDLPLASWPAPRYLQPGQSITCRVALDNCLQPGFGAKAPAAAVRPLHDVTLTVRALVDPQQRGDELTSAAPSLTVEPLVLNRPSLLGRFDRSDLGQWAAAYELALGRIVRDLRRGDLPTRLAAARNIASLLATMDRRDEGTVPPELAGTVQRPVLLAMLKAMLGDSSATVRAEMVASLQGVHLDERILGLLGGVISDPSPRVRFRVAELLGASDTKGKETVLTMFESDSDEMVRLMAGAFSDTDIRSAEVPSPSAEMTPMELPSLIPPVE